MGMEQIEHVVVLMMENRSLDNLLGWLYADPTHQPAANIPPILPPTYDGLKPETYFNQLSSPASPRVYATHPTNSWPPACPHASQVPTPDPHEEFEFITKQLFGDTPPTPNVPPSMDGFLENYSTTDAGKACAGQIMESFGPKEAGVINGLARSFAISDRWFSSAPTQTWPNRGFVHTGSSDGHINNEGYEPYKNQTIFNVLSDHGKSWGVFHDTIYVPSLTHIQFEKLWDKDTKFHKFDEFKQRCAAKPDADPECKLPAYSFVEPRFVPEPGEWWRLFRPYYPSDYHPPHDVLRGERFLATVYQAIRSCAYRDKILFIVTFDEHGGCYDHTPSPWGSVAPLPGPVAELNGFKFDRFGVRVPTILISSFLKPGTVFRADPAGPQYDHTSILATLRDWLHLDSNPAQPFLPSPRIQLAPTLDRVLTLTEAEKNTNWPVISAEYRFASKDTPDSIPLNDVQKSLLAHMKRRESAEPQLMLNHAEDTKRDMRTYQHALDYLKTRSKLGTPVG